jgi:hypothetical protein
MLLESLQHRVLTDRIVGGMYGTPPKDLPDLDEVRSAFEAHLIEGFTTAAISVEKRELLRALGLRR